MVAGKWAAGPLAVLVLAGVPAGCTSSAPAAGRDGRIPIVAAENQYGDVAAQVGGAYVRVVSVETNPDTDPHTYEASAALAQAIAGASVVIQNGLGYDSFMATIEAAAGSAHRRIIDVAKLLGRDGKDTNPHLWYDPATMPAVASALADQLAALQPQHAGYFRANAARFTSSLQPWRAALSQLHTDHPYLPVATTEPVADYLLRAAGAAVLTPSSFEADIMNGLDPAPQGLTAETDLLRHHRVRALVYNQQVTDSVTAGFVAEARRDGIPVVAVYETMPVPGYDYQSWMLAETRALERAVTAGVSTGHL